MITDLKPYPEYKDSGLPWLGNVPRHWDIRPGFAAFREKKVKNIGLREKTVLSLSYGRIVVKPPEKLHGLVPDSFETYQIVDPGDIIIRSTDLQNDWNSLRVGLVRNRGIITSAYLCFRVTGALIPEYGYQMLHAFDLMKVFYGMGSGLRQNLDFSDFKRMFIFVPPTDEQAAIVQFLDCANRRLERTIRAKRRVIALLNEQKQAIIHRAVTRGLDPNVQLKPSGIAWLGEIPAHWEVKRIKWVTQLQRGYDLPQEHRKCGTVPVVSSGGVIDTHCEARAQGPGVVMGRYGSTDAVFYIDQDFWPHNTSLFVTNFYDNFPKWCFYLLRTISKSDYSSKSAVPGVDRKDLYEIYVPQPPHEEQVKIVHGIEQHLQGFNTAINRTEREITLLHEYRTRLIADVVTGKLDVCEVARHLPVEADDPETLIDGSPLGKGEESFDNDIEMIAGDVEDSRE
jgi:type I restriction enzyme S subunit